VPTLPRIFEMILENVLKFDKLADSDLQTPQKQPPVRQ